MRNCNESLKVDPSKVPHNERVYDVDHEPVHLAHGGACHRRAHQDGGGGEEQEEEGENTVAQAKVNQE